MMRRAFETVAIDRLDRIGETKREQRTSLVPCFRTDVFCPVTQPAFRMDRPTARVAVNVIYPFTVFVFIRHPSPAVQTHSTAQTVKKTLACSVYMMEEPARSWRGKKLHPQT